MRARAGRQSQPSGCEYSQHVAVSERNCIASQRTHFCDHTIDSHAELLRSFSASAAAIVEDCPARMVSLNLVGGQSFVIAVVPFHQIRINLGARSQSRQFTGLPRPSQRARQHQVEIRRDEFLTQESRSLAAVLGQRDIRDTGVLAAATPFRLAGA